MSVSEQASKKVVPAGHYPGSSTFPGTPTSGGWIPIFAKRSDSARPFQIDWLCPVCKRLTANSRSCPGCGLGVKVSPKTREPLPKRMKMQIYRNWDELDALIKGEDAGSRQIHEEPKPDKRTLVHAGPPKVQ